MTTLRPYQTEALSHLRESFRRGNRRPVLQAPTGCGKTTIAQAVASSAVEKGKRVLFLAPRRELIYQAHERFVMAGIPAGIIMAGERRIPSTVYVASFDTLHARAIRSERMLMPEADVVIVDECFPGDVEILTESGFVRFDQLERGVRVAQVEAVSRALTFVDPMEYVEKPYRGELTRLYAKQGIDLTMTPNHEVYAYSHGADKHKKCSVSDMRFNSNWEMFSGGFHQEGERLLTPWERLMIAHQADGSLHRECKDGTVSIIFSFARQRKIDAFLRLMADGGFRWSEVSCDRNRRRFHVMGLRGATKNLWDHFDLAAIHFHKALSILGAMEMWDGSRIRGSMSYFSSVDERQVDFYQCVATIGGLRARKSVQRDDRSETFRDVHRLHIQGSGRFGTQNIKKIATPHSGKVYCVRVPHGNIVVRSAGRTLMVGNCHLSISETRQTILKQYPKSVIIGLSATPSRGDGRGLGEIYDDLILSWPMQELVDHGYLVPARYYAPTEPDLEGLRLNKHGDYQEKGLAERMNKAKLVGDVVEHWEALASDRPTVVFGVDRAHSRALCEEFVRHGYTAEHLDGETPLKERAGILDRVERGETQVLCNVYVATFGLDIPKLSCAVLARPTRNLTLYLQTGGRVLRPAEGKTDALILDHAGAVHQHGFLCDEHPWSLDGNDKVQDRERQRKEEKKEPKEITCVQCKAVFKGSRKCPWCGHEMVPPAEPIPVHEGSLEEVTKKAKKNNRDYTWPEKIAFMQGLRGYAESHGYSDGWAANSYKEKFGVYPNDSRVRYASAVTPTPEVASWIKSRQIAYAKRRTQ